LIHFPSSWPFRHTVWDDRLTVSRLHNVVSEWPDKDDSLWYASSCGKLSMCSGFPDSTIRIAEILKSKAMIETLEREFGILGLVCDETNFDGGLHWMPVGTKLDMHVDFNQNKEGLYRRVNALLFLNDKWKEDDKGELILGRKPHTASIAPLFNRLVAFPYNENAWHGVPEPVKKDRKSIAAYYYTKEKPPGFSEYHSTIYERNTR